MATKESRFSQIYRQELAKNKGIMGSFARSGDARAKEMLDLRRFLLPQSGVSGAIAQQVFGKSYRYGSRKDNVGSVPSTNSTPAKVSNDRLVPIEINSKITAKNSMVLPDMARDMNLMRLNMQKMVRLSGGKASIKSDMFFKRSAERESAYESKFKKEGSLLGSTASAAGGVVGGLANAAGGMLGGAAKLLGGIGGGLFSIGSSIIGGLVGILGSTAGAIFKVIGGGLAMLGPIGIVLSGLAAYLIYEMSKSIDFKGMGESIKNFFTSGQFLEKMYGGAQNLDTFFGTNFFTPMLDKTVEMFIKMYNAISDFTFDVKFTIEDMASDVTAIISDMATNIMMALGVSAAAGGLADVIGEGRGRRRGGRAPRTAPPRSLPSAGAGASDILGPTGRPLPSALPPASTASKASNIAKRIGVAAARRGAAAGLAVVGGPAGAVIGTILAVGFTINDIRDILAEAEVKRNDLSELQTSGLITEQEKLLFEDILDEETIRAELTKLNLSASDKADLTNRLNEIESRAPARAELLQKLKLENTNPTGADVRQGLREEQKRAARIPIPEPRAPQRVVDPRFRTANANEGISSSEDYNTRIARYESGGNYNALFGQASGGKINGKDPTENTIGEIIAWQKSMKGTNRQAAGKYQFIDVARSAALAGIDSNQLFNAANQDRMMNAYTEDNKNTLLRLGVPATNENLAMAHAVGPQGVSRLLNAPSDANALSVLGLSGAAATTNPHLNKPVSEVIASLSSRAGSGVSPAPSPVAGAPRTAPPETTQENTMLADLGAMMGVVFAMIGDTNKSVQQMTAVAARPSTPPSTGPIPSPYDSQLFESLLRHHSELGSSILES